MVLCVSFVAGATGIGTLLLLIPGLPGLLVWGISTILGGLYAGVQVEVVSEFPRIRERWEITPASRPGMAQRPGADALVVHVILWTLVAVLIPIFQQARQKARRARGEIIQTPAETTGPPPLLLAGLPVALTGGFAVLWWGLRATRRLYHMAMEGDLVGTRRLLDRGADTNGKDAVVGRTPLIWAITESFSKPGDRVEIARLLLERGEDPNLKDADHREEFFGGLEFRRGKAPLLHAAPFPEFVEPLLAAGADVHARDEDGETALIRAARHGCGTFWKPAWAVESIRLLLAHGAEVDARDHRGRTALIAADLSAEIVAALLHAGADVNAADHEGVTPLIAFAGHNGDRQEGADATPVDAIRLLLDHGADIHARDAKGRSALQAAREKKADEVVELLIQAGATD